MSAAAVIILAGMPAVVAGAALAFVVDFRRRLLDEDEGGR